MAEQTVGGVAFRQAQASDLVTLTVKAAQEYRNGNRRAVCVNVGGQNDREALGIAVRCASLGKIRQFFPCSDGHAAFSGKYGRAQGNQQDEHQQSGEDPCRQLILIRANGSEIFMEKLKKRFTDYILNDSDIPEDMRHSKMVSLRVCYFAGGIVNLYKQWFRGDLDCTLNDIALEVSKLLQLEAKELF